MTVGAAPVPQQAYERWLDSLTRAGWPGRPGPGGADAERVPVADALGRVTAEPVIARWPSPRSACAAMDGIAVAAAVLARLAAAAGSPVTGPRVTDSPVTGPLVTDSPASGSLTSGAPDGANGAPDGDGAEGDGVHGAVRVPAGAFAWIDTGDLLPDWADTVAERERVAVQADGSVLVMPGAGWRSGGAGHGGHGDHARHAGPAGPGGAASPVPAGRNVRPAGEDFAAGEVLVPSGRRLRPGDLAAAAAGGQTTLAVARQPAVAIIPTGDEIRPVGAPLGPGDIMDTNSLMLAARCRQLGAVPMVSDVVPDDPDTLAAEIRRASLSADLVLVIAGSSRGRDDHAGSVLAQVGGVAIAGVAIRPGHPALLGHVKRPTAGPCPHPPCPPVTGKRGAPRPWTGQADAGQAEPGRRAAPDRGGITPVIGLPGYPLATAVIFELFGVPLLAAITGHAPGNPRVRARLDRDWTSRPGTEDWVPVTLTPDGGGPPRATPARRGSGSTSMLARADAWWPIPAGQDSFAAGAEIEVLPIPGTG